MKTVKRMALFSAVSAMSLAACGDTDKKTKSDDKTNSPSAFTSTYEALPNESILITNAHIFDGLGGEIESGSLIIGRL